MKLKNWIKYVDFCTYVILWGKDKEPLFKGFVMDIPWIFTEKTIGRNEDSEEEPIYVSICKNENGVTLPTLIINLLEKEGK